MERRPQLPTEPPAHVPARPRRARFDGALGLCFTAALNLSSPPIDFAPRVWRRTISAVASVALLLAGDRAEAVPLRVRGRLQIAPKAARARGALEIRGVVTRDDGSPAAVPVLVARADGAARLPSLAGCRNDGASPKPIAKGPGFLTKSDDTGRFCVRFPEGSAAEALALVVSVADSESDVGARATVDADAGKRNPTLAFHPVPHTLVLDGAPNETVTLAATATSEEDGIVHAEPQLPLLLRFSPSATPDAVEPPPTELARGTTNDAGEVTFTVPRSALGAPGPVRVAVVHTGGPETGAARTEIQAMRVANVQLAIDFPKEAVSSEDGFSLAVRASAGGKPVAGGSVEVAVGETIVGAATVSAEGVAQVPVAFARNASGAATLQIRYLSSVPWLRPGTATLGTVATKGPNPFRRLGPLLGTILLAFAAFALRRQTAPKAALKPSSATKTPVIPALPLPAPREAGELVGRVVDEHDGMAIAGAELSLLGRDFSGGVLAQARTEADGTFRFSATETPAAVTLAVRAPFHREAHVAVGANGGAVRVQLVSRRRGVLQDLVAWARSGAEGGGKREPTPAEIAKTVTSSKISAWANAVEAAGFSAAPLDAAGEAAVDALRPAPEPPRERAVAVVEPAADTTG